MAATDGSGRERDEAAREALQQIDARQPGPLAVGREQLVGLLRLDPPAAQRRQQLYEAEGAGEAPGVGGEPPFAAAEPPERDDPDRPRADAALALQPRGDAVARHLLQPLEVDRAAE